MKLVLFERLETVDCLDSDDPSTVTSDAVREQRVEGKRRFPERYQRIH